MNVLFLDIDGVLNGHDWHEGARSNTLRKDCIDQLSRVLKETGCKIVLSSAWRYMIHDRALTCRGFEYLLRTHGCCGIVGKIIGVTRRDEDCAHCGHRHRRGSRGRWNERGYWECRRCGKESTRGDQIRAWSFGQSLVPLMDEEKREPGCAVALDDEDLGIIAAGIRLVLTDGATGLVAAQADEVIRLFAEKLP